MSLNNYTTQGPNDPSNPQGPPGAGGQGPGSPPPMGQAAQKNSDIEELLINYNDRFANSDPVLFREQLVDQMNSVLISKNKPNTLLVGSAGVGKTKLAEDLGRMLATDDPRLPQKLTGHTVYELPLANLVAGAGIVGELEERMVSMVDFASDPKNKAIIFIDEIHLLGSKSQTYEKIAQILKPALSRGDMHVIGATTSQESREIDKDPAFARRFTRLIVDQLSREQTVEVIKGARSSLLRHYQHKVSVNDAVLEALPAIADTHSRSEQNRPDNALTLLDRTMATTLVDHNAAIASAVLRGDTVAEQALRSAGTLPVNEAKLEQIAKKLMTGFAVQPSFDREALVQGLDYIQGQQQALDEVIEAAARDALGIFPRSTPLSMIFPGPSGVGKTETAKVLSEFLTGQEPIILSMGEYSNKSDINKILGSPPGYVGSESNQEKPLDSLESNPYRVIILDELEKADTSIHSLFLGALDEGYLRTAAGKVIDMSKAILVITTNAARDSLSKPPTGFSAASEARISRQDLVKELQHSFTPEFLGRLDRIIAFDKIQRETYRSILLDAYRRERERILAESPRKGRKIPQQVDDDVLDRTVAETYLPDQGARPAEHAARTLIENAVLSASAASSQPAQPAVSAAPTSTEDD